MIANAVRSLAVADFQDVLSAGGQMQGATEQDYRLRSIAGVGLVEQERCLSMLAPTSISLQVCCFTMLLGHGDAEPGMKPCAYCRCMLRLHACATSCICLASVMKEGKQRRVVRNR